MKTCWIIFYSVPFVGCMYVPEYTARVPEDRGPVCVCALVPPLPPAVRQDDGRHDHYQRLVDNRPLEVVAGGQVPEDPGDQLLHLIVPGLPQ